MDQYEARGLGKCRQGHRLLSWGTIAKSTVRPAHFLFSAPFFDQNYRFLKSAESFRH